VGRPVIFNLPLAIRHDEVVHHLGYPDGRRPPERIERRLRSVLQEARGLAHGRGAWHVMPAADSDRVGLETIEAEGLVVAAVTAGQGIEACARTCLDRADTLGALLFEAAGAAAAEEAADRLSALLLGAGQGPVAEASCRISPGYARWPLQGQRSILALLPARELGIHLASSGLMFPRKSVTFALWLGAQSPPRAGLAGCQACELEQCRYRRTA
jgi:hypothetical protein